MLTKILQHDIDYEFRELNNLELNEYDIEHIECQIKDGYNRGELCQYNQNTNIEYLGWWEIKRG